MKKSEFHRTMEQQRPQPPYKGLEKDQKKGQKGYGKTPQPSISVDIKTYHEGCINIFFTCDGSKFSFDEYELTPLELLEILQKWYENKFNH